MSFKLPNLHYALNALSPFISEETLKYHYGKHHKGYINKLNELIYGTKFAGEQLEIILKTSDGKIFNNAAQAWNHSFYWNCLTPEKGQEPSKALLNEINKKFGSMSSFKQEFTQKASDLFGSGWAWLIKNKYDKSLEIITTNNADNPINKNKIPLLICDVWEHAYYIDYRNARAKYLKNFWNLVCWKFVSYSFSK